MILIFFWLFPFFHIFSLFFPLFQSSSLLEVALLDGVFDEVCGLLQV